MNGVSVLQKRQTRVREQERESERDTKRDRYREMDIALHKMMIKTIER